jgi:DNA-binding NarL/FixJ family response regulator
VDDHASVRKSLWYLLEAAGDIKVVAMASNGMDALDHANAHLPDVAIVDISMPLMDGIETARLIRVRSPNTRILMLSIYDNAEYVQRALKAGAAGYVLKDMIGEDLIAGIRALYNGRTYFSGKIAETADQYIHQKKDASSTSATIEDAL